MTVGRSVVKVLVAATAMAASPLWWPATGVSPAFAAAPPAPSSGIDPVIAAREVLQAQDFWWKRLEARTVPTSWLESILKAVVDLFGRILRAAWDLFLEILRKIFGMFSLGGVEGGGAIVVSLIAAAILGWSAWKLYPLIARRLGRMPQPGDRVDATWETLPESADLFEQAGDAFRGGHYAEAIRLALLSLIARLEKQGLLRYDTARTNREYQRELRRSAEVAARFGQLARIYERVWYGRGSAGRDDAEQAIRLCAAAIGREEPAPE